MRPRVLRRRLVLAWFGAIVAGIVIVLAAPPARAATEDGGDHHMDLLQFLGYFAAQLILVGSIVFAVLIAVLRAVDWWADRREDAK